MNIARSHLDALEAAGYTEAEARFLYIVATHSGYFVARQFLAFQRVHWGKRTTVFWNKLERLKHARIERFPKSGTISVRASSIARSKKSAFAIAASTKSNSSNGASPSLIS